MHSTNSADDNSSVLLNLSSKQNSAPPINFKFERVVEGSSTQAASSGGHTTPLFFGSTPSGSNLSKGGPDQSAFTSKKDMEWVAVLIGDLKKVSEKEYAEHLLHVIS